MPTHRHPSSLLVAVLLVLAPSAALAEPSIYMTPPFGGRFASDEEVQSRAGDVQTTLVCPAAAPDDNSAWTNVGLKVAVSGPLTVSGDAAVLSRLAHDAVGTLFRDCPTYIPGTIMQDLSVGFVEISAPAQWGGRPRPVARLNHFGFGGWNEVIDVRAAQARAAAEAASRRAEEQAQAAQQQRWAEERAIADAKARVFWQAVWGLVRLGAFAAAAFWLYGRREPIARWYYFNFHPHPALPMVRAAIASDNESEIDAEALADALGELPPDGAILRGVRLEQAEQLFGELKVASARRQKIYERQARTQAIERYEHAAFYGSQEAIALATVALEKAKASYQAATSLRRIRS